MKPTLLRLGAGVTAVALAGAPVVANAADEPTVDPDDGPVSYAIPAAFNLPDGTQKHDPTSGVKHMIRSPESPGQVTPPDEAPSKYPYVESLGVTADPDGAAGQHIALNDNERPEGADADETYFVGAGLQDTKIPTAVIDADIGVTSFNTAKSGSPSEPLVYLDNMESQAACAAPDDVAAITGADDLWMRQPDGSLENVDIPDGSTTIEDVPLDVVGVGPERAKDEDLYGDVTLTRVTDADQLITPEEFRLGDHNAVTGWRVDIDHYWKHDGEREDLIHSAMLLGAVTCSLPEDFEALADKDDDSGNSDKDDSGNAGEDGDDGDDAEVPTRIPSGGGPVDSGSHGAVVGAGAVGAVALGSTGLVAYRRRRALSSAE